MKVQAAPSENLSGEKATEESKPKGQMGGWAVALVFFALLAILIFANM